VAQSVITGIAVNWRLNARRRGQELGMANLGGFRSGGLIQECVGRRRGASR